MVLGGDRLGGAVIEEDGQRQDRMDGLGRGVVGGSGSRNFARGSGIEGGSRGERPGGGVRNGWMGQLGARVCPNRHVGGLFI